MPTAADLLRGGVWTVSQVAVLLDTPECLVERWCCLRMIPGARLRAGDWEIPGPGLFFFCSGKIEPHYSPATAGALLDQSEDTIRGWIKHKRLKVVKLGNKKSSPVRIAESELRRFLGR